MSEIEAGNRYYHCEMLVKDIVKREKNGDTRASIYVDDAEAQILIDLLNREIYLQKSEHRFAWVVIYDAIDDTIKAAPSRFFREGGRHNAGAAKGIIALVPHRSDLADELWGAHYHDVLKWLDTGVPIAPPCWEVVMSRYDASFNRQEQELKRA